MSASPFSDSASDFAPALHFSDTIRKVDRAVARLEELQCVVRSSHTNATTYAKRSPPICRSKLASDAEVAQKHAQHAGSSSKKPALPIQDQKHGRSSNKSAISRRCVQVSDVPSYKQATSSPTDTPMVSLLPRRMQSQPDMPLSSPSPPSSCCSSSVQVVTRRARHIKDMASSKQPRTCDADAGIADPNAAPSKLPRTFFVHAGPANPNRPWCLSTSPSPAATTSSTTSNYIYSPSSNSSLPTRYPSRFSPLHRQISACKSHETLQSQPLLCRSPQCTTNKPIKASPKCSQKPPWLSQTRLSLPSLTAPSHSAKRRARRFSLTSNRHQDSPPRPLPALITRLPTRHKKASSPTKKPAASSPWRNAHPSAGSTPDASLQKGQTMVSRAACITVKSPSKRSISPPIPPLPLPPALRARPSSTQHLPTSCEKKASHKRSSSYSCQCLLPLADNADNGDVSLSPLHAQHTKRACSGKENCFSGCGPAAWPMCFRRSWSFSQQPGLEHSNFNGPACYNVQGSHMQNGKIRNSQSQVYNADSSLRERHQDRRNLYIG